MTNNDVLKKQLIYRSEHRGTKEMDLLLGSFVKKYINKLGNNDLKDLMNILLIEDDVLKIWYYSKKSQNPVLNTKVSLMLKNFLIE